MNDELVVREERTAALENASYRLAYAVLSFGAMIIAAYRGFLFKQGLWDLLVLVIASSALVVAYQAVSRAFTRQTLVAMVVLAVICGLIALGVTFLL